MLKDKLQKLAEIQGRYETEMAPLIAELEPYLRAAEEAKRIGIRPNASADEVIDAWAGSVSIDPPVAAAIPQILKAGDPEEIRKAGAQFVESFRATGAAIGSLIGIVAGMR